MLLPATALLVAAVQHRLYLMFGYKLNSSIVLQACPVDLGRCCCCACLVLQSARGPRITGWYEDVSVYTLIYNILAYNKIVNVHDYVEYGLGKVRVFRSDWLHQYDATQDAAAKGCQVSYATRAQRPAPQAQLQFVSLLMQGCLSGVSRTTPACLSTPHRCCKQTNATQA